MYHNINYDTQYVSKDMILSKFTEEQIFGLVFDEIEEYKFICSPFREDNNPGCWFEIYNSKLYFCDFGSGTRVNIDCFEAVRLFYNIDSFPKVLQYIWNNVKEVNSFVPLSKEHKEKNKKYINIVPRDFYHCDKEFWSKYEISKQNLIDDSVYAVSKINYKTDNDKKNIHIECYDICYAFTEFEDDRKKLYFPFKQKEKRFKSVCNKNDIGSINHIDYNNSTIVITKSYKDCRVLRNQGINSIWLQNEGCLPDKEIFFPILNEFKNIIIFYDNDETGIKAGNNIVSYINSDFNSRNIFLPEKLLEIKVKDPSDLIVKDKNVLIEFLKTNKVYEST